MSGFSAEEEERTNGPRSSTKRDRKVTYKVEKESSRLSKSGLVPVGGDNDFAVDEFDLTRPIDIATDVCALCKEVLDIECITECETANQLSIIGTRFWALPQDSNADNVIRGKQGLGYGRL